MPKQREKMNRWVQRGGVGHCCLRGRATLVRHTHACLFASGCVWTRAHRPSNQAVVQGEVTCISAVCQIRTGSDWAAAGGAFASRHTLLLPCVQVRAVTWSAWCWACERACLHAVARVVGAPVHACMHACVRACMQLHTHTLTQHSHVYSRFPAPPPRSSGPAWSASLCLTASAPASRPSRLSLSRNSGVSASMAVRASAFVPCPCLPPTALGSNRGASSVCPNIFMTMNDCTRVYLSM